MAAPDAAGVMPAVLTDASVTTTDRDASAADAGAAPMVDSGQPVATSAACPPEMVLVDGNYCPIVDQTCLDWMDYGEWWGYRCKRYQKPAKCLSNGRRKMRFCIDREEYAPAGQTIPVNQQSYEMSAAVCASRGARNCAESEWQFACEGEDMHPYPYGDGFTRDATACNIDQPHVSDGKQLLDLRAPIGEYPRCVSPFGVHDMSGNVEEWATKDAPPQPPPMRASMKGAWWLPGKNTCRAATVDHDEHYRGIQTGIRCCRDADR